MAAPLLSGVMRKSADAAVLGHAAQCRHLLGGALLDGDVAAVVERPVDRRAGQRDIEGHAVVLGRQRLEIGADLVADVAARRRPVRADDAEIDLAALHQMAAGIVDDHRVRHAVAAQLPSGQRGALVARTGLVDPDMHRHPGVARLEDRRQRRAPIDRRQPAGVAMGQYVERTLLPFLPPVILEQGERVLPDGPVRRNILIADFGGAGIGGLDPVRRRQRAQTVAHVVQRPAQVDSRRPGCPQPVAGGFERLVRGIAAQGQAQAIGRRRPDQWRPAHPHDRDGLRGILKRMQRPGRELEGQQGLVDDRDRAAGIEPDRAVGRAVNAHGRGFRA